MNGNLDLILSGAVVQQWSTCSARGKDGAEQRRVQKMLTCVTELVGADAGSSQKMPNSGRSCS